MTPSLPTFFIASASIWPISASPLEEIVPIWAISSLVDTGLARFLTSARMSIPRNMRSRASVLCLMSLAAMIFNLRYSCRARASSASGGDDAHNVGFFHDQQFLAVKFDLGAGPFAEQHAIVRLYVEGL